MKREKYKLKNANIFKGYSINWLKRYLKCDDLHPDEYIYILNFKQIYMYINTKKMADNYLKVKVQRGIDGRLRFMKKGDIVFSVVGKINRIEVLYVDFEPEEYILYDDTAIVIRDENTTFNSEYLYMMFCRTSITSKLLQQRNLKKRPNAMPRLTITMLSDLEIPVPDEAEMKELLRIQHRLKDEEEVLKNRNILYCQALEKYLDSNKIQLEEILKYLRY